jgi:TetR/AcrR family transcriptional regulator, regulator of cefoperazone and chloramphenicol sensitivity
MKKNDNETRANLLEAAKRLFAERGFRKVTVREICRAAGANVAAVNYHFQGKEGLYRAVLEDGIALIRETTDLSLRAPAGATAEDRLRSFIRTAVGRMMSGGDDNWLARVLRHEFENPTEALDRVVERAIGPRMRALAALVADVLGCGPDDPRVGHSVASIHVQLMIAARRWRDLGERLHVRRSPTAEELGHHIAEFSVGGLHAIREARAVRRA